MKTEKELRQDILATIAEKELREYWEVRAERMVPCSVVTCLKWRPTRKDLFQDNVQPRLTCRVLGVEMEFKNIDGYCHWQAAESQTKNIPGGVDGAGFSFGGEVAVGDGADEGGGRPGGAAGQGLMQAQGGGGLSGDAGQGGSGSSGSAGHGGGKRVKETNPGSEPELELEETAKKMAKK
jgi:hypothetical protein